MISESARAGARLVPLGEGGGGTEPAHGANRDESLLNRPLIRQGDWLNCRDVTDGRFHEWSTVPLM